MHGEPRNKNGLSDSTSAIPRLRAQCIMCNCVSYYIIYIICVMCIMCIMCVICAMQWCPVPIFLGGAPLQFLFLLFLVILLISCKNWHLTLNITGKLQGRPQDLEGGGPRNLFFRFGNLHVVKRHAAHGEAMRIARGVRGHAPPKKFFKTVQFGAF